MKKIIIIAVIQILICKTYGQNYPFRLYGGGLDGSTYQQTVIYSDVNGLLIEAPIDPNNNKLPVSFSWRGGGIPSLFISSDSKIGIGTAAPEVKLDVLSSNVAAFFRSTINTVPVSIINSGSSISTVGFKGSTSASEYNVRVGADGNDFITYTNNVERMRITSNGNVGIGTNNPIVKLEVVDGLSWFGRPSNKVDNHNATEFGNTVEFNNSFVSGQAGYVSAYFPTHNNFLFGADYDGHLGGTPPNIQFGRINNPYLHIQNNGSTSGNVGIGTTAPDEKLTVKGKIHTQEVKVDMAGPLIPDYVFANDYKLKTLQEVDAYIKKNRHLPEIPSAEEIEKNGLMLAEMNMGLLKKIEELTLYMIEMKKENDKQNNKNEQQNSKIEEQNQEFRILKEKVKKMEGSSNKR